MSVIRLQVKAVPGTKRDEIAGRLGDRLKVRISAPPEDGRANEGICSVIADALGLRRRDLAIISGHASPEKMLEITGSSEERVSGLIGN